MNLFRGIATAITRWKSRKTTTRTSEPFLGIPVRYDENLKSICESRGVFRWKEIVVGPDFARFPAGEQAALLTHEAGHCKRFHVERRLLALLTPWRLKRLCIEQEFEADRFARAMGFGPLLASAFARLAPAKQVLHPPRHERIMRLI